MVHDFHDLACLKMAFSVSNYCLLVEKELSNNATSEMDIDYRDINTNEVVMTDCLMTYAQIANEYTMINPCLYF